MALTGRIVASIYRIGNSDIVNGTLGRSYSLPSFACTSRNLTTPVVANGVTCPTVITYNPTGLVVDRTDYYTDSTVPQLQTNGF